MQKRSARRSSPASAAKPAGLELHPSRAFVVHLDVHAELPGRVVGRVEHVTSGQVAHVCSARELIAFMARVLRTRCAASAAPRAQPKEGRPGDDD